MTNENLIIISGGAYNDVKKALRQWIDLYTDDLQDGLTFELFKNGHGNHIILADERIDNERFYYLVNYLNYPEGIKYKIDIEGFTTGKENNVLKDQKLLVYISSTDKEGDNVFVTTSSNNNYKIDFGRGISDTRVRKLFRLPINLNLDNPEVLKVNKQVVSRQIKGKSKDSLEKRFRIISFIAIILFLTSLSTLFYNSQTFIQATFFLGMGLGLWFFIDFKMLRSDKYYFYGLLISIIFLGYTVLIKKVLNNMEVDFVDLGAFYPLTLLIIQWPTRKIYIMLFKREPEVDKHGKFADMIYTIILFFGFAVLPFIIMDNLK
ncbi:hypothetical protein [Flavobacterium sp. LB3P21]|uniref:hypothetical protein n=1 Tax=unclassified Flavobacterium TaxID=196869 RepID=UPI003AAD36EC